MRFKSRFSIVGDMRIESDPGLKHEPMFFSADVDFAYRRGGPITRRFLEVLPGRGAWRVFDSRVHMLMPGWFPCIPGWHHDDVPRPPGGQPDYENMKYESQHVACVLDMGTKSLTEFIDDSVTLRKPRRGETVYEVWNKQLKRMVRQKRIMPWVAPNGKLVAFDWETFHRGVPAKGNGWRWFGRISAYTDRPILNEVRPQVQVYLPALEAGW